MKTILFLALMATMSLAACEKYEARPKEALHPTTQAQVQIAFGTPAVRAFGNGTTEAWEKSVGSAAVLVFAADGSIRFRRDLSALEIANATTTPISLVIPGVSVGESCKFCVVANRSIAFSVTTKAQLLAEEENDAAAYNGAFADVMTRSLRPGGFAMTGSTTAAIATGTTTISVDLKRTVAKVEIAAATTPVFAAKYGPATITVTRATIGRGEERSYLIDQAPGRYLTAGADFSCQQATANGQNLFYLYEKAAAAAGSKILLTLDATYDADGSTTTTADQVPVIYELEVEGAGAGQILRNGAYKVNAAINGLTGNDVSLTITIANWETLQTQNISVGD